MSDPCRESFERWMTGANKWPQCVSKTVNGDYVLLATGARWDAWQEAWAASGKHYQAVFAQMALDGGDVSMADAIAEHAVTWQ